MESKSKRGVIISNFWQIITKNDLAVIVEQKPINLEEKEKVVEALIISLSACSEEFIYSRY